MFRHGDNTDMVPGDLFTTEIDMTMSLSPTLLKAHSNRHAPWASHPHRRSIAMVLSTPGVDLYFIICDNKLGWISRDLLGRDATTRVEARVKK